MAEQGFILDIDTQFLQRLEKADKALDKMVSSVDRVASSLDGIASGPLSNFASAIDSIVNSINTMSGTKVGDMGLSDVSEKATEAADSVNRVLDVISKLQVGDTTYSNNALSKNTQELETSIAELSSIQTQIHETLDSDLEYVDTSELIERSNFLMGYIELLETERESIIETSKVKIKDAKEQEELDKRWLKMEDERNELIKERARIESELAKRSSQNYASGFRDERLAAKLQYADQQKEYERIFGAIARADQKLMEMYAKQNEAAKVGGNEARENYERQIHEYEKMYDAIDKSRRKNERDEEASIAREDAANKRKAQSVIDNYVKETKAARDAYEKRQKMYEDLFKQQEEKERRTLSGAMGFSKGAGSISERQQAIKYLSEARDSLNESEFNSAKEYKQAVGAINKEINRQKTYVDELRDKHKSLINIADQLKRAFTLAFSVSAIRGYVNQLMKVRGEFELQQRALTAIVKNKAQANEVWQQTIKLAVKSPFSVQEMVTSTKQLAAYRVETEKLVETNKMLSDISAGVGVDMSRLILAFGQVKAANYLRGTELRQFSEAGINILDELAKHFSALEGTTVNVGEVFERVSKRMVSFADVETVLKKVTSAGGAFYRMQEVQSETLRGQISNLKDAISLMYNEIGEANDFALKGAVSVSRLLVENWKAIARILEVIIVIVSANKLTHFVNAFNEKTGETVGLFKALKNMTKGGLNSAKDFFAGLNPAAIGASLAVAAVSSAVAELIRHRQALKEIRREMDNVRLSLDGVTLSFNNAFNAGKASEMREQLLQLATLLKNEFNVDNILPEADVLKAMDTSQLEAEFTKIRQIVIDMTDDYAELAKEADVANSRLFRTIGAGVAPGVGSWWQLVSDTLEGDLEDYSETAQKTYEAVRNSYSNHINQMVYSTKRDGQELTEEQKALMSTLGEGQRIGETRIQYLARMKSAYDELALSSDVFAKSSKKTRDMLDKLFSGRDYREALKEVGIILRTFDDDVKSLTKEEKEIRIKASIDRHATKKGWDDFMKELAYDAANRRFIINIVPYVQTPTPKKLKEWQESYNAYFEKLQGSRFTPLDAEADSGKRQVDLIEELKRDYIDTEDLLKRVKAASTDAYPDKDAVKLQQKLNDLLARGIYLGVDFASSQKDATKTQDEMYQERLRVLKDMHDKYKELRKDLSDSESQSLVVTKFADAFATAFEDFADFNIDEIDWRSELGMEQALKKLLETLPATAKEARFAIQQELADIRGEVRLEAKMADDESLKQSIEDLFSGYELSIELDKLNISKSFAKDFFNLDALTLSELRAKVESMRPQFVGMGMIDEYNGYLKKISEMEAEAQQERLKKYLAYSRDAIGERAKIKLEEMKKLQEIEIAFAQKPFEKEQERAVRETAKASAIEGVQNEAYQATKKLEWEEFQKSDTFISIFQDLDMASEALLNHAITKLREFKNSWIDMPHEEMKSIVQNIEKLEMQLASMGNPFKGYIELQKELKGVGSIEEIQLDTIRQEAKIEALDKELSISEQVLSLHQEGKELEADELAFASDRLDLFGVFTKEVKDIVDGQKLSKKEAQDQINVNNANLSKIKASKEELIKQADAIGKARNMANDLYDAFKNLNDTLSDSDGPTAIFAEMGMSMMNSVFNCIMLQKQLKAASEGADDFGKAMNKAMGVIGWIVMGVQVLSSVLGAVFQAHDNKLERQIQRIQSRVEELNDRLETLDELMDKAFSTEAIEAYSLETQKNIEAQIDAYDRMIALEKDKKKTDSAKIKEYREAQNDLRDQYEEMIREAFSTATSGVLDDVLSTSRGFVDAWYEAFKETGNGVGGLKKQFDSLFKDIILQQAALQVMSPYIEMLKDEVAKYIDPEQHDYTLTPEEAMQLKNFSDWWAQSSNEAMSNFANAFGFGSLEQGDLSDLSKGIQGITESTAQVLEALLNSMRFFVADSNTQLRDLKAAFMSSDVTMNPILNELKQHTQLIRSIESMLDSVIGRGGSSHNGAYLRVLM